MAHFALLSASAAAQEEEIDPSKPTNLYSNIDNNLEWIDTGEGTNLFGYRAQGSIALNPNNLLLVEVPLLYNDKTEEFGLGDLRVRYFQLPHLDYSRKFAAFGWSADIFAPTGKFEDGLGTSSWIVAPGVVAGFFLSPKIQTFPIISYQFISEPTTASIPTEQKESKHGLTFQAITALTPFKNGWFWLTPIVAIRDLGNDDDKGTAFILEANLGYKIAPTLSIGVFSRRNFDTDATSVRGSVTLYL